MSFDHDERVVIYPAYLDAKKTVAQGRRVPKTVAAQDFTAEDIYLCAVHGLKLEAELENKRYPRDWLVPGRVRVKLKNDAGRLVNDSIPSKQVLMVKIAELLPKLKRPQQRPSPANMLAAMMSQPSTSAAAAPKAVKDTKQSAKSNKKKKGK